MVNVEKQKIREDILDKLKNQDVDEKSRKSELIKEQIVFTKEYQKAKLIFTYVSTELEVDTWSLIRDSFAKHKRVSVPVITSYKSREMIASEIKDVSFLKKNKWGIYQPKKGDISVLDKKSIDLILVPGIAFDSNGNRLGKGKGFFDKFLSDIKNIPIFGLAFSFQIINSLPINKFDIPVSKIFSS